MFVLANLVKLVAGKTRTKCQKHMQCPPYLPLSSELDTSTDYILQYFPSIASSTIIMAEALWRAWQAEVRKRLDEEWVAIAEARRLLDEDEQKVIEERRRLAERRRLFEEERRIMVERERLVDEGRRLMDEKRRIMEDERSILEDEKRSIDEDRQRMIEEREDIDRIRERARSSLRTIKRTARELAGDGSSPSSPEGRPAKRPRRTSGGIEMRPEPTIMPETSTSSRNGTDPVGLSAASDEIKNLWRQVEFPQGWTGANSDFLLELFTKNTGKKFLPGSRPVALLDTLATKDHCLIIRLKRNGQNMDNGPTRRCSQCRSKGWPCIAVDFTGAGPDNEPYDEDGQGKRWKLSIRND